MRDHFGRGLIPVRTKETRDNDQMNRLPEDEQEHAGLVPAMLVSTAIAAIYIIVQS